ncbi:MAG: ABC transporter permease DevC [Gemmataceae bacterium]
MTQRLHVPLAWRNLTYNPLRLVLFCAGIGFAVVLMFLQFGSRNALLDSNVLLLRRLRGDLFLVSGRQTTIILRSPLARTQLYRARGVADVASAHPIYLEYASSVLRSTDPDERHRDPAQIIRVVGVEADIFALDFPALDPSAPQSEVQALQLTGRALFDRFSKRKGVFSEEYTYGPVEVGTTTDLAGQEIVIVGFFDLGMDFGTDGTLIVSLDTFRRNLRSRPYGPDMEEVDIGIIRLCPGADRARCQEQLTALYADEDIQVLTRDELIEREQHFWTTSTPIGIVFGFGMFMGFLVGLIICYQILSSDIRDNLGAYATLRAIGYSNYFLTRVVIEEALLLAVLGFFPGWLASLAVFRVLAALTDLPMSMTLPRILILFSLTLGMCVLSALLAVRQALQADPAEVF